MAPIRTWLNLRDRIFTISYIDFSQCYVLGEILINTFFNTQLSTFTWSFFNRFNRSPNFLKNWVMTLEYLTDYDDNKFFKTYDSNSAKQFCMNSKHSFFLLQFKNELNSASFVFVRYRYYPDIKFSFPFISVRLRSFSFATFHHRPYHHDCSQLSWTFITEFSRFYLKEKIQTLIKTNSFRRKGTTMDSGNSHGRYERWWTVANENERKWKEKMLLKVVTEPWLCDNASKTDMTWSHDILGGPMSFNGHLSHCIITI